MSWYASELCARRSRQGAKGEFVAARFVALRGATASVRVTTYACCARRAVASGKILVCASGTITLSSFYDSSPSHCLTTFSFSSSRVPPRPPPPPLLPAFHLKGPVWEGVVGHRVAGTGGTVGCGAPGGQAGSGAWACVPTVRITGEHGRTGTACGQPAWVVGEGTHPWHGTAGGNRQVQGWQEGMGTAATTVWHREGR